MADQDFQPLDRDGIARRIAQDIPEGWFVNLGIGIPTKVSDFVPAGREVIFHSENGIVGVGPAKTTKTTLPGEKPVAAPDLVKRNFTATRPDQLWLADFTYVRTWQGWAYLAVVLDVYTRRIVAGSSPRTCVRASSVTPSRWRLRPAPSTRAFWSHIRTTARTPRMSTPSA